MVRGVKPLVVKVGSVAFLLVVPLAILAVGRAAANQTSDRALAEQILAELGRTSGRDWALVQAPLQEAKNALARANSARAAGDLRNAERLEGLARDWAWTARDLVRASAAEADAGTLQHAAAEAGVRAERSRALLEEAIARRGRALAEFERMSAAADAGADSRTKAASSKTLAARTVRDGPATRPAGSVAAPRSTGAP